MSEVKMLTCRVCSPTVEIEHVIRPLVLDDGKVTDSNVWTCAKCNNQKRTEPAKNPINMTELPDGRIKIGTEEEGIVLENVEGQPNPDAVLNEKLIEALGLKKVYRAIGLCLEQKIPIYESEVGMAAVDYMNKATTKLYITKYDLIATPCNDLIKIKKWCIYLERTINDKEIKAGAYVDDDKISNIEAVKAIIREIDTVINKKFGN